MKKLDWYIVKKFLLSFFYILGAFCVITMVFDLAENVDDMVVNNAPLGEVLLDYYVNLFFHFGSMLSAFIVFITIILVTSNLAQKSEFIAMLSGGVSFRRLLRPYFIASTFLVVLSLIVAHIILPEANKTRVDFIFNYIHTKFYISDQNMYREIEPGTIAYFRTITAERNVGYKFSLENWKDGELTRKITASKGRFDAEKERWILSAVVVRDFHDDGSQTVRQVNEIDTVLPMRIDDFGQRAEIISTLNYSELTEYIEKERLKGSGNVAFIEIEKYSRTSNAFAIYVLTLIGVSIASRKVRGGTGLHLFFAVLIGVTYIFALKMTTVAATNVGLPTQIAVWVPNFLFLLVGLVIYVRAPK